GDLDLVEGILYMMTLGFICDEVAKLYKVGLFYIGFWNVFNNCLYALLTASFVIRMFALAHSPNQHDERRRELNQLGYHIFCFSAPMFWMRLLLYLDTFRFFGAMLVVLKVMMRESLIFFLLLVVVCVGFLQAFIGLNQVEGNASITTFVLTAMANSVMQSPDFDGFDNYAHPFGLILYYIFTFVVMVILLNILIALYNSAYEDITENAIDEYMAMFAQKTLQFVRAPDENVFIAPLNLIELFLLIIPFEWWMEKKRYQRLNDYVMGVIYSPLLLITAAVEAREARSVRDNRSRGEEDDDTIEEWEELQGELDFESEGWDKKVKSSKPIVDVDADVVEIRELKQQIKELKEM
ncbi:Calcium channel yvc1, partial [Exophiala xenobiotica]